MEPQGATSSHPDLLRAGLRDEDVHVCAHACTHMHTPMITAMVLVHQDVLVPVHTGPLGEGDH